MKRLYPRIFHCLGPFGPFGDVGISGFVQSCGVSQCNRLNVQHIAHKIEIPYILVRSITLIALIKVF
jgi:hypothetical protein